MTECEKLRSDLKAFLDGQLSPASRIALRLHLNRCESCRRELEAMRLLGTDLRDADNLEMSDALRSRILASVPTTPPPASVKMLPKWREKPVMMWGASASAALAWFLLYPALSDYQNHATTKSNKAQVGLGLLQYTQDYDAVKPGAPNSLPSGISLASKANGQNYYAVGKHDGVPSWMTRRMVPADAQGQATNGRAPDDAVVRQTELIAKADPRQRNAGTWALQAQHSASSTDEKSLYFDSNRVKDSPEVAADGHTKYFPYANGLTPLADNGDGNPAGGTDSERTDRRYVAPSKALAAEGVRNNMNLPVLAANPDEKVETDPARNIRDRSKLVAAPKVRMQISEAYLSQDDLPTERQVHKEANLTIEVANAEQQSEAVERLVKESKGYVAQNQLTTVEDNTRQATLTCKVPVDLFDTVMGQVARLGPLTGKTLSGEDITDKVSDEQETGHVLRADILTTEEKLKERKRHSDVVRDEETLRQLRIRVAQSQARLKMLNKLGALSEITIELDEKPKNALPAVVKPANPFMEEVSNTGQAAAHTFVMALRLPVQLLVWIVVYSPLWALLYFGYRRFTR